LLSYLYRLILHEDGNFRLKNRAHARAAQDDTMGPGFAYLVDPTPFAKYILDYLNKFGDKEEVSVPDASCVRSVSKRVRHADQHLRWFPSPRACQHEDVARTGRNRRWRRMLQAWPLEALRHG
jgi:hypothetical protein